MGRGKYIYNYYKIIYNKKQTGGIEIWNCINQDDRALFKATWFEFQWVSSSMCES